MLSRVADSVYWMYRYMERAQSMARFIDADFNNVLQNPDDQDRVWKSLIAVTGDKGVFEQHYDTYSRDQIIKFLTIDERYVNSVFSSLKAARENARSIREIISSETWEAVNSLYLRVKEYAQKGEVEDLLDLGKELREGGYSFTGMFYSTMNRGEAWHFARMGMLTERADKTSRILDVKSYILMPQAQVGGAFDRMQWGALLKSESALEMYRKKYRAIEPRSVIGFLLFDEEFPRSVRHCCRYVYESLKALCLEIGSAPDSEVIDTTHELLRDLDFSHLDEVLNTGMHQYIDHLQSRINLIGLKIHQQYFNFQTPVPEVAPHGSESCA